MAATALKAGAFASLFAIFIAFFVRRHLDELLRDRLTSVLNGLVEVEKEHSVFEQPRVAVGYGGCHDLFVNAEDVLDFEEAAKEPQHYNYIKTYDQLLKTYAYFFRHGAAAERYMDNDTLFFELLEKASEAPEPRWGLGGNAPVMAARFNTEGCKVLLAMHLSYNFKRRLPAGIEALSSKENVEIDDTHIILEYKTAEEWGPYTAPRANRFIVHSDMQNPLVNTLDEFGPRLEEFRPHLFVVGGLQMMDHFPYTRGKRRELLTRIQGQMRNLMPITRIHFEMASFTDMRLIKELIELIVPYSDSLGMNEQELTNLDQILLYGNVSIVSDSNPRIATVLDQMRRVFATVHTMGVAAEDGHPLSRLHVHTLAYQIIATVGGSQWKNTKAAAAKASLTANRHVCGSPEVDIDKAMLIMDESFSVSNRAGSRRVPLDAKQPVACWKETLKPSAGAELHLEICVAPVLVCTEADVTAGGGDNISSAGLVLQI